MRITKTADVVASLEARKAAANQECQKCPCCGETKTIMEYLREGTFNKGISSGCVKIWIEGFIKLRSMKSDLYKCYSCWAEWESEPYQWI